MKLLSISNPSENLKKNPKKKNRKIILFLDFNAMHLFPFQDSVRLLAVEACVSIAQLLPQDDVEHVSGS